MEEVDPPPDPQPAQTHGPTREALRRWKRRTLRFSCLPVVALVAFGLVQDLGDSRYERLERTGVHTSGTVVGIGSSARQTNNIVFVEFAAGGETHRAEVRLDPESANYHVGQVVPVVHPRSDPDGATIVGERNFRFIGVVLVFICVVLILSLGFGAARWVSFVRARRALRSRPWRARPFSVGIDVAGAWYLTLDDAPLHVVQDRYRSRHWKPMLRRLHGPEAPPAVWVSEDDDGRPVVVATPGLKDFFLVRVADHGEDATASNRLRPPRAQARR